MTRACPPQPGPIGSRLFLAAWWWRGLGQNGMASMSFDGMANLYDETRIFDKACLDAALGYLVARFPPAEFRAVFEPGIGTGRIALPLAERGYHVTGGDISAEMLRLLKVRLGKLEGPLPVSFLKADTTALPFPDGAFDMAVAVHLFYFMRDWKRGVDEILRVVKPAGPFILMHTGTGAAIPFLNARYKGLCALEGYLIRDVGVKSTDEVAEYLEGLGCSIERVEDRWKWTARIRLDTALSHLKARAYTFPTAPPDAVHSRVIARLESELSDRFGSPSAEVNIPNELSLVVVARGA